MTEWRYPVLTARGEAVEIMARAMSKSRAWPVVFSPGSSTELAEAALAALEQRAENHVGEAVEKADENVRWCIRMAEIREASGIGVKPMLSEVPAALKAQRERLAHAEAILSEIAKGTTPPERYGHYLAHRKAVDAARAYFSPGEPQ